MAILKLDVYTSIVLGLPTFIDRRHIHIDLKGHESMVDSPAEGRTNTAAVIALEVAWKHLELLNITASGLDVIFPSRMYSTIQDPSQRLFPVEVKHLEVISDQFQAWAQTLSPLLEHMGSNRSYEA
jgi:hypothetical protein